jgi:hypothetical protein
MDENQLLVSHDELRAVLRMALRELRRLQPGNTDLPVVRMIRDVLTDTRGVAERYRDCEFSDDRICAPAPWPSIP